MRYGILFGLIILVPLLLFAEESKNLYVEVRQSKVREKPLHWAKSTADVVYGDKLTLISLNDPWYQVKTKTGASGFIHTTAVTKKVVVFKGAGAVDSSVSQSDIVLAGKGFNKEIEQKYAGDAPSLDYNQVNKMEVSKISAAKLANFIVQGKLNSQGVHTHAAGYAQK